MKRLAIKGKLVDISKISEKSEAQFGAQLKQNGIVLTVEELHEVYVQIHDSKESQIPEEVQAMKAAAEAKAAAVKAEMEAKFNK